MNLFGKEPQEQAMQKLVHDLNSATTDINHYISKLSEWLKENSKQMYEMGIKTSVPHIVVEYVKSRNKEIQDAQDKYYEHFKADFK